MLDAYDPRAAGRIHPSQRQLELELPVYDALYAWAQGETKAGRT